MAVLPWRWTSARRNASLPDVKIFRPFVCLLSLSVLAGCSCLPGGSLDQKGLSAQNVKPSQITAPDEVPSEPRG
jgi:hypothetical protein